MARNIRSRVSGKKDAKQPDFVIRDPFGFQSGRAMTDVIFDLSSDLPFSVFRDMADICIARAANDPSPLKVLVFENHTKDLQTPLHFNRIAKLIDHIHTTHSNVEFRSFVQLADQLDLNAW